MKRIVVDLTEFRTWSGHLTGVQRVVHGLAKALYETEDAAVAYVTFNKSFEQVDIRELLNTINSKEHTATSVDTAIGFRRKAKTILQKAYHKTPAVVKDHLTPARKDKLKRVIKAAYHKAQKLKNIKNYRPEVASSAEKFEFKAGDVLLSAGRAWDDPTYITRLEEIKKTQNIELAYVVYDLIPIYQQHTFGQGLTERYSRYLYRILKHADYLLPISKSSAADIRRFANEIGVLELPQIEVIRLGDDIADKESATQPSFIRNPGSFTMCVGTIEARKNHMAIYYAYKLAAEKGISLPDMYIVGRPGWLTGDVIYFLQHDLEIKDKITFVHDVSDDELAWMYKNALFTTYPSQYEGWGLPIAESLSHGTPAIASHASSMAEIAPKLVDYVSPFDTAEFLEKMVYYSDEAHSMQKRKTITKEYKQHTWQHTVKTIRALLTR